MKRLILLIVSMIPMIVSAQISSVSEAQKQQALQTATEFCTLFEQWSNGQRLLDQQIYALCSGKDCSAYDDVSTNSETSLRNYLLGIQKKYPQRLAVQISKPSLANSNIVYAPKINFTDRIGSIANMNTPFASGVITELTTESYSNAYIVFKISQNIPTLGKSNNRLLIYDINAKKITAYVTGGGTFISYMDGLNLMVKSDYENAMKKFDMALNNKRASIREDCLIFGLMCSLYTLNFQKMKSYATQLNDEFIIQLADGMIYLENNEGQKAFDCVLKCERILDSDNSGRYEGFRQTLYYELGLLYVASYDFNQSLYNPSKAIDYLKKSCELGYDVSAFLLWYCYTHNEDVEKLITKEQVFNYVFWAAEVGHPACIVLSGQYAEHSKMDNNEAMKWYTKGANSGDPICMASLGKLLIESKNPVNISTGKEWLRKSLGGNALEKNLEGYQDLINDNFWPKSRAQVQGLLNAVSNGTSGGGSSVSSSETQTTTNSSSSVYSNTYSSSSLNTSYSTNHRGEFNKKQDDYWGGLSIGFVQKQWVVDYGDEKEKMGVFNDDKVVNGIQAGFIVDPQFCYGFGINTGLFYEYYFAKSDEIDEGYGPYRYKFQEHSLYLPLHFKYSMNFSEWFQLSLYGGLGLDYGLVGKLSIHGDNYEPDSESVYSEENEWKRFNYSLEYGASIRIKNIQCNFTKAIGLSNWANYDNYTLKQNKNLSLSVAFCY